MANLKQIKELITSRLQSMRPSSDFSIPDMAMHAIILQEAAAMLFEKQEQGGGMAISDSAFTLFECNQISKVDSSCSENCRYVLNLPFFPMGSSGAEAIKSVTISESGILVSRMPSRAVIGKASVEYGPSYKNPGWAITGQKMYFSGGDRDFSKCKVDILAAPSTVSDNVTSCVAETSPVPLWNPSAEAFLVDRIVVKLSQSIFTLPSDNATDGNISVQ